MNEILQRLLFPLSLPPSLATYLGRSGSTPTQGAGRTKAAGRWPSLEGVGREGGREGR